MGVLGHFGLGRPLALEEIPSPGPKSEKNAIFLVLGVPKRGKKLPRYPEWLSETFLHHTFWPTRTPTDGKSQNTCILGHVGPGRPLGLGEIPGAGRMRKKMPFPGARAPEMEIFFTTLSGCPQLFCIFRFARPDPTGGKSQNMGILAHFGLGRPLSCLVCLVFHIHLCARVPAL